MAFPLLAPIDMARSRLGLFIRDVLQGDPMAESDLAGTDGDMGLFGPGSIVWQVHGDASMLIGGVRALMMQTLHPLAMAGVADHSNYREDPFGRLHRTGGFIGATTFGTTVAAQRAIDQVRAIPPHVTGVAPDGRPYSAEDPHLLAWVHVALVDSLLSSYQRYGAKRLSTAEADEYVASYAQVALALGSEPVPMSVAELKQWLRDIRPELHAGRQAKETVRFLLVPNLPLVMRPPYAVVAAAAVGLLPGWARRMLRIPRVPIVEQAAIPPVLAIVRTMGWVLGPPQVPALDPAA
jgi:uncharacterized protein (DUF2236 family)